MSFDSDVTTPTSALVADDGDRGGLAVERRDAGGLRRLRVGDVDEADPLAGAVGIDERHPVRRGGDDLGDRPGLRVGVGGKVVDDVERGDAVEHFGVGGCGGGDGEEGSARGGAGADDGHGGSPCFSGGDGRE